MANIAAWNMKTYAVPSYYAIFSTKKWTNKVIETKNPAGNETQREQTGLWMTRNLCLNRQSAVGHSIITRFVEQNDIMSRNLQVCAYHPIRNI